VNGRHYEQIGGTKSVEEAIIIQLSDKVDPVFYSEVRGQAETAVGFFSVDIARVANDREMYRRREILHLGKGRNEYGHPFVRRQPSDVKGQQSIADLELST
jgi:hypothetical protein